MTFYRCNNANDNSMEPLKHVSIPVGGFNVEANGTAVSYPNNVKNVFPKCYHKMVASDFSVSANLGGGVYGGKSDSTGYTRANVSNVKYDADTGTLTASVSISRGGGRVEQIFQQAFAKWKGTVNGVVI